MGGGEARTMWQLTPELNQDSDHEPSALKLKVDATIIMLHTCCRSLPEA